MMRFSRWLASFAVFFWAGAIQAQTFTPGNLIVERFGDGAATLSSTATAVFLDQFSPVVPGVPLNSTAMPTVASGLNAISTNSGTATSNGYLSRTVDGLSLVTSGYNATLGTGSIAASNPATINRTIGLVNGNGTINTSNGFNNGPSNNFRGVVSVDGSSVYAATAGGIFFKSMDGTVSAATQITTTNTRNMQIANNSLFFSSSSGAFVGVNLVGTAGTLPTSTATSTLLPGTGTSGTGTASPYGFVLFDNPNNANNFAGTGFDTLYVADDRTVTNGGGIQRWSFDGTTWTLTGTAQYTVGTTPAGFRGLTASISGSTVSLFATSVTSATAGSNDLVALTDVLSNSGGAFGTFVTLATSPTNTAFRGVAFAPVPEPAGLLVLGAACAGLGFRRLRKMARAN